MPLACVYASRRHVTWRLAEGSLSPPPSVQEEPAPAQDGRVFSLCIPLAFQRQGSAGQPRVLWEMSFKFSLLLSPAAWLPGPSCHWMGCGKTALVSRADISICLPDSSDARKLHQDFISPPPPLVQHPALSGPCQPGPPTSDRLHRSFYTKPASGSSKPRGPA